MQVFACILFECSSNKKLLKITRNTKKKHNKIVMLATNKLSRIEILISQALKDSEISHKEYNIIINEEEK